MEIFYPVPIETKLSGQHGVRRQTAFATIPLFFGNARDVHPTSLLAAGASTQWGRQQTGTGPITSNACVDAYHGMNRDRG
jgi:hypothetical protein